MERIIPKALQRGRDNTPNAVYRVLHPRTATKGRLE